MKNRGWTVRVRLTLIFGGFFLVAGVGLLAVTYLLLAQALDSQKVSAGVMGTSIKTVTDGTPPGTIPAEEQANVERKLVFAKQVQEEFKQETLNSLVKWGAIALGGVGVAGVWLGWLAAGRTLQPIKQITATARRVADRSLHERIALGGPRDELRELADTFDDMLERLDRSFDGQRRFVGNASHELRTPLAINRTLLEVAMSRPDAPPQLTQLGDTLLEVNARHEKLIDGLLTLARSEQAVADPLPVDLAEVAEQVAGLAEPEAARAGVRLSVESSAAPTAGDPVLLERLVQNLVQNAVRYNEAEGWVHVACAQAGDQVRLSVTNTGPVVRAYEIPGLFEPFRRLDSRVGSARGTGLGLSIVRSVARAHGGEAYAHPHDRGGLIVQVTLPATQREKNERSSAAHSDSRTPAYTSGR